MLENKEIDQSFDEGAGNLIVDVDAQGGIELSVKYKKDLNGFAEVESGLSLKANFLNIAQKIAEKTDTKWDDSLVSGLKSLLGIK